MSTNSKTEAFLTDAQYQSLSDEALLSVKVVTHTGSGVFITGEPADIATIKRKHLAQSADHNRFPKGRW